MRRSERSQAELVTGGEEMSVGRRVAFTTPEGDSTRKALQILLDTSTSMASRMEELNLRLGRWLDGLRENPVWLASLDVAVITFGGNVEIRDLRHPDRCLDPNAGAAAFVPLGEVVNPHLRPTGATTPMVDAIELRLSGRDCYRPYQLLITDGVPNTEHGYLDTDGIQRGRRRLAAEQGARHVLFRAIAIAGADRQYLTQLAGTAAATSVIDDRGDGGVDFESLLATVTNSVEMVFGPEMSQMIGGRDDWGRVAIQGASPEVLPSIDGPTLASSPERVDAGTPVGELPAEIVEEHELISEEIQARSRDALAGFGLRVPGRGGGRV
jgi:uncharacterized protein YegL